MSDPRTSTTATSADVGTATASPDPSVVVDHVDLHYKIHSHGQPKLRKLVTRDKNRGGYRTVRAVNDVSFIAHPGESIGIIGHNGSGKSTLMRGLAGLLPVTNGRVFARARPVLLGVSAALQSDVSGRRNVFIGGTALGIPRAQLEERFDDIVAFAGLQDFIELPLRAYSSGMRARLQFAIATAVTPDILIVDEALSVGDERFRRRTNRRIKNMMGEAGTVFLVTHSMSAVRDICTRVLWLNEGCLLADGDPAEVIEMYENHVSDD